MAQRSAPVKLVYRQETHTVSAGMTLRSALEEAGINPEAVLGLREGKLIPDDCVLEKGETIKLVAVISGG